MNRVYKAWLVLTFQVDFVELKWALNPNSKTLSLVFVLNNVS